MADAPLSTSAAISFFAHTHRLINIHVIKRDPNDNVAYII